MILKNLTRRKAIEMDHAQLDEAVSRLKENVCIGIIAKRYAVYVVATRGLISFSGAKLSSEFMGHPLRPWRSKSQTSS